METYLEALVSPQTRRSYKAGLAKFLEFYGKDLKTFLRQKDPGKIIERYYVWLRKKYTKNSCRALTNPIIQYCKYNDIQPKIRKSLDIYGSTITTRDHILQVSEAQEMYSIGSLEEKVMVKTWLLGLRIGDVCRLEWKQFDITPSENLVEILVNTRKEGIVAHCFIDPEFQRLLAKHIPNLDQDNKYLFQSERQGHLSEKQLLRKLQSLQRLSHVKAKGSFGWHLGRKLFLRVCAENGVVSWNAKLLCGKSVDKSIATYINGVSLRKDAKKVSKVLRMQPVQTNGRITNMEQMVDLMLQAWKKIIMAEIKELPISGITGIAFEEMSAEELLRLFLEKT